MKIKHILTTCILLLSTHTGLAETLPSLQGVADPHFAEASVVDTTFPKHLEKQGDIHSAILEWQRIVYESFDARERAQAQLELARLLITEGQYKRAHGVLVAIGEEKESQAFIPQALYYMSVISDLQQQMNDGEIYRKRLRTLYPESPYIDAAERHMLWSRALSAKENFPEVVSPKAKKLRQHLLETPAKDPQKANTATILSLIPGVGHLYLGDWRTALMAFAFNVILLSALISALRNRHYAYSTFFGLIVSIVYVGTLFSAYTLAQRTAFEGRLNKMQHWHELRPELIKPIHPVHLTMHHPIESPLWVYRHIISQFDGDRSNAYPVNSSYAHEAIQKHGVMLGSLFMVDRLLRDWREIETPLAEVQIDGRLYYIDPLSRNDFWLDNRTS